MSVSAAMYLELDRVCDPIKIIRALLHDGWSYDDHGHITYLPVGDNEDYNWQFADLNDWGEVTRVLQDKFVSSEPLGLSLLWSHTQVGGNFIFDPNNKSVAVHLCINRVSIGSNTQTTNFQWYEEKIFPAFEKNALGILKCERDAGL